MGCGSGINFLSNQYWNTYTGVDYEIHRKKVLKLPRSQFISSTLPNIQGIDADIVVCTLVLNNKRFNPEYTVRSVENLIMLTRKDGFLFMTLGAVNMAYFENVKKILLANFETVKFTRYGGLNIDAGVLSYPLAWLQLLFPYLRRSSTNPMYYIECSKKSTTYDT